VYYLPDSANNSIPEDIRRQFQRDGYGRILFFTAPPVETAPKGARIGHTAKYLAWKAEREQMLKEKRKRAADAPTSQQTKRARSEELAHSLAQAKLTALDNLNDMLAEGTVAEYQATFGERWKEAIELDLAALEKGQDAVGKVLRDKGVREGERERWERGQLQIRGLGVGGLALDLRVKT
jgi:chromatin structure-remodeling complex subunit RSC1/2